MEPEPTSEIPSAGVFLRDPSPYLHEFQKKAKLLSLKKNAFHLGTPDIKYENQYQIDIA